MPRWFQLAWLHHSVRGKSVTPSRRDVVEMTGMTMKLWKCPDSWDRHLLPAGPWQHPRGSMHGLANGEIRKNAREMDVFQSVKGRR